MERTILHCDLNNFYASVECFLEPKLKPYPVAVCGNAEERHGIVLAKNYKSKAFGVTTGEAIWQAKQKCPDLVVVDPHYSEYMKFSKAAREIYERYTDQVEPFGMDECWLDVSGLTKLFGSGKRIANEIRERIKFELGLTISVGVSFNKIFAKLGSDMKKPDAVTCIQKEDFREIVWKLPASDLLGVGRSTSKKLRSVGINTIGDIARLPADIITRKLGKCGTDIWRFANGLDNSRVAASDYEFPVKSVGHGITTLQDLENSAEVWKVMLALCQEIGHKLCTYEKKATGIAIDIRDNELFTKHWQCATPVSTQSPSFIAKSAFELFDRNYSWKKPIRSLAVRAIDLVPMDHADQLSFFIDADSIDRRERLDNAVEDIRRRFGKDIILNACLLNNPKMPPDCPARTVLPNGVPV